MNVLLLCIDALRKDHVVPEVMPYLCGRSVAGVAMENLWIETDRWTLPSVASLMFGDDLAYARGPNGNTGRQTLAGRMRSSHRTGAFLGNPVFEMYSGTWLFRDFEVVHACGATGPLDWKPRSLSKVWDDFTGWRMEAGDGRPWFAYVHLVETHEPYLPNTKVPFPGLQSLPDQERRELLHGRFKQLDGPARYALRALRFPEPILVYLRYRYRIYCAQTDMLLSERLSEVEDGQTLVFVLSDHGEALGEDGVWSHGPDPSFRTEAVSHVAGFAWGPGIQAGQRSERQSMATVSDTLAGLLYETDERWQREQEQITQRLTALGYME